MLYTLLDHTLMNTSEREVFGAPLVDTVCFRVQRRLNVFIRGLAMAEKTDPSAVIRRMLITQAEREGFDADGA